MSTTPPMAHTSATATVEDAHDGMRLDAYLAMALADLSRSRLQALIREGAVTRAGATIGEPRHRVKPGETYVVDLPPPVPAEPKPEAIALDVAYEDESLIVIDKPAGLVVHPAAGHATGTLVNALIAHCGESLSGIGGVRRPGIVHRLDKDTSGLLVVAKTDQAHQGLAEQFATHGADGRLERTYLAIVWGHLPRPRGTIDAAMARSTASRTKMAVSRSELARHATTHYEVMEAFDDSEARPLASLVRCRLETGRTHQIRVHLAHIGHPLLGDATYGAGFATRIVRLQPAARHALALLGRQALHAAELGFEHPRTGEPLHFESPLPADLALLLETLRNP